MKRKLVTIACIIFFFGFVHLPNIFVLQKNKNKTTKNINFLKTKSFQNLIQRIHFMKNMSGFYLGARFQGRLGNQLFITASSFGVAKVVNKKWCLFENDKQHISQYIQWVEEPYVCPDLNYETLSEKDRHGTHMTNLYDNIQKNVIIATYLQSYKYFDSFNLPFELLKNAWAIQWSKAYSIHACIHIRRGDYLDNEIYRNMLPDLNFYKAAIFLIRRAHPNTTFFVASDDLQYVKSSEIFEGMHTSNNLAPDEIMAIMSTCNHTVMSVGSFGWWGVYLSSRHNGLKIYYNEKRANTFWSTWQITESDYYPPNWIGLNESSIKQILK